MTILAGDIKLVASQVMLDVDNGGGAPVAAEIVDGQSNTIFPDISELDRAGGRVNLRKVFVQVQTINTDGFYGANVVLADPPDDPNVSVTLFSTEATFDERLDARNRIESYLTIGPSLGGYLFGNHITGQMSVTMLAREGLALPAVGETLVLGKIAAGVVAYSQYVRVTDVSSRQRTFTDERGDFTRLEITIAISDALRQDFFGLDAIRNDSIMMYEGKTRLFGTVVADAARYAGVVPLTASAAQGASSVQARGIFTQLVPSAQVETPIADARMNQQTAAVVPAGGAVSQAISAYFDTTHSLYVGGAMLPGSVRVQRAGITLVDNGGRLNNEADSADVGAVDYANGVLSLNSAVFGVGTGTQNVSYTMADAPTVVTQSIGVPITASSQRSTLTLTLAPVPARVSLQVSYMAQGRWYVLTEDGSGAVRGADSAYGVGTLNFTTGTVSMTLGALPDVGSEVIFSWAPAVVAPTLASVATTASAVDGRVHGELHLANSIVPGTLTLSWNDGAARTATDDGAGHLSGYAVGDVDYSSGTVLISPTLLPAPGTALSVAYTQASRVTTSVASFGSNGSDWTFTLPYSGIRPRSLALGVGTQRPDRRYPGTDVTLQQTIKVFDDGAGHLQIGTPAGDMTVGSINYASGACVLVKNLAGYQVRQDVFEVRTPMPGGEQFVAKVGFEMRAVTLSFLSTGVVGVAGYTPWWTTPGGAAEASYIGALGGAASETLAWSAIYLLKAPSRFTLGTGPGYYSRGLEATVYFPDSTGAGSQVVGLVGQYGQQHALQDVFFAKATLNTWLDGVSPVVGNGSGVVQPNIAGSDTDMLADSITLRSAAAPLRNGSVSVVGLWMDGTTFTATADADGIFMSAGQPATPTEYGTPGVVGKVDYATGIMHLRFGDIVGSGIPGGGVSVSSLGIPGVTRMLSRGVRADSLRYNASAYTYLPLDADIIGIDPVRLPSDGKVPIFRPGSFSVLGHTGTVGPATVANGQVINCGRTRLARVRVLGGNGVAIATGFSADLDTGLVTFTDVAGYAQPVTVEHRVEDMMLIRDAQISGQVSFTRPLTHAYPVGSYLSSALVAGDLQARVSELFDQTSWAGLWADVRSGGDATGTFNAAVAPIVVTNHGALTERWAVVFTNTNTFSVMGEHVGVIATGNTASNCAPLNPSTGTPYFSIPATGWGAGWAIGNVLRFNTVGAEFPVWVARTILQGPETGTADSFTLLVRGDVDRV